jgi:hypothetical protein
MAGKADIKPRFRRMHDFATRLLDRGFGTVSMISPAFPSRSAAFSKSRMTAYAARSFVGNG